SFGQRFDLLTQNLLHQPLHPVSRNRLAHLAADGDADPDRSVVKPPQTVHDKLPVGRRGTGAEHPSEIVPPPQAVFPLQGRPSFRNLKASQISVWNGLSRK